VERFTPNQKQENYGYDLPMAYGEVFIRQIAEGLLRWRFGRFISVPDIEDQLAPNNYMYTHSIDLHRRTNYTTPGFRHAGRDQELDAASWGYRSAATPGRGNGNAGARSRKSVPEPGGFREHYAQGSRRDPMRDRRRRLTSDNGQRQRLRLR